VKNKALYIFTDLKFVLFEINDASYGFVNILSAILNNSAT
jgi:hypothetical protein